jgi:hypothetical protein
MVDFRVTIDEQLRAINAGQVRNGMIVGPAFATVRDLVVQQGRAYTIQPLPRGQWSRGLQACYANALHAAMTGRWVYVEGFAIPDNGELAILHAWVTDPKNPVVAYDPTWGKGREYYGIPFQLEYVLRVQQRAGHPGVLDTWELGWPILRGEDQITDVIWTPG